MSGRVVSAPQSIPPSDVRRSRRHDIEGLRAIAALLVAAFHIWLGRVSGGVDVFLVVSGFLITTTLLGHIRRFGRIRPLYYLGRLARRLLPAALTVLGAVTAAALLLFPLDQLRQTLREVVASALYSENWFLAFESIDYLAVDAFHSPAQHFWAMSAQGQFYLVWLVLFLAGLAFARTFKLPLAAFFALSLSIVFVASLTFSVVSTAHNQPFAYYDTLARVWEFALGGLAAMLLGRIDLPGRFRWALGWIGLLAILSCGVVLQVSDVFPGWAALWPTLAAVAVLAAGSGTGASSEEGLGTSATRVLSLPPLVWLGRISYGIYLWHWPILVFALVARDGRPLGVLAGSAVIASSVVLAWLTHWFVERPFNTAAESSRRRQRVGTKIGLAVALTAVVAGALTAGGVVERRVEAQLAVGAELVSNEGSCLGMAFQEEPRCADWVPPSPSIPEAPRKDYSEAYDPDCRVEPSEYAFRECSWGSPDADVRVVLIGNSHAISWFPALREISAVEGWRLDVFFKSACAFNTAERDLADDVRQSCTEWNHELHGVLADRPAYDYMLTSYFAGEAEFVDEHGNPSDEAGIDGFRESWGPLVERGTEVWAVRDVPTMSRSFYDCYQTNLYDLTSCGPALRTDLVEQNDLLVAAARDQHGVRTVDMTEYFCGEEHCSLVVGGVNIYRDSSHLTATFSQTMAPYLYRELGLGEFQVAESSGKGT